MSQNADGAGNGVKEELGHEEFLTLLAEQNAAADRQAAPLRMLQTVEDAMIAAGTIDPAKGEILEFFGINDQGVFEKRIGYSEARAREAAGSSRR